MNKSLYICNINSNIPDAKTINIICGPTASGKTNLAYEMADHSSVIANIDVMQLYKNLPILSASPNKFMQNAKKHILYNILEDDHIYDVAKYLQDAENLIEKQSENIIFVGGSCMYIDALIYGITYVPNISIQTKQEAEKHLELYGPSNILLKLNAIDSRHAKSFSKNDKQRIRRAYEVFLETGKAIFYWQSFHNHMPKYNCIIHLMLPDRDILYDNCNHRFDMMLKDGAVEEVEALLVRGAKFDAPIFRTIGALEIANYIKGELKFDDMKAQITAKTRQYAKRQNTWFKRYLKLQG